MANEMKSISETIEAKQLDSLSQTQFAEELRTAREALRRALPADKPGAAVRYQRMFRRYSERFSRPV